MATTAITSGTSYKAKYQRALGTLAQWREASRDPMKRFMSAGGAAVGGGIAGVMQAKIPKVKDVPTIPVAGGVMLAISALNAKEEWSGTAADVAGGLLAVATAQQTNKWASQA